MIVGITEASATRSPSTPNTRSWGSTTLPIAHVPAAWKSVCVERLMKSMMSASEREAGAL